MDGHPPSLGGSSAKPMDGHPPPQGWSPTRGKCTTFLEFGICTLLTKLTPGKNLHGWYSAIPKMVPPTQGWSPTNQRMVTHQRGVCSIQGIWHSDLTYQNNTRWHLPWMVSHHPWEGHQPTQGWSPTIGKCTTDLEISTYTLLAKLTPDITAMDGHPPTLGWSPNGRKCPTDLDFGNYTLLTYCILHIAEVCPTFI